VIGQSSVILAFGKLQKRAGVIDARGRPKYEFHALLRVKMAASGDGT
jgi:hypothetical protein